MTPPDAAPVPQDDDRWKDAVRVAALFAVDPAGLAGVSVKAQPGWVRDEWLALLRDLLPPAAPFRRVPLNTSENRLLGGLDLAATLQSGRPVAERGILAEVDGGVLLLAMAERAGAATVGQLASCLDLGELRVERDGMGFRHPARFGIVALDESTAEEEPPLPALLDRLAFRIDLSLTGMRDVAPAEGLAATVAEARLRLSGIDCADPILEALCGTALVLGVGSMRPSLLALRAARALAALAGRTAISAEDAALAARLVLAPRATRIPAAPEEATDGAGEEPEDSQPEPADSSAGDDRPATVAPGQPLDDMVLASAKAAIPLGLLARLRQGKAERMRTGGQGRAGATRAAARRGRPVGVRKGVPGGGARLSVIETLRAAAPWQRVRRAQSAAAPGRIEIRRDDWRIVRLKQRAETTTIFVVDASGSSALDRLAEAKGAIELLLGECYVRRDSVALIAFRGRGAAILLPPTRSLVRAKRCLAGLPGGGGTPLAAGIDAGAALADGVRRQGRTPVVIVMTDGRANIGRDGKAGRVQAEAEALAAARTFRDTGIAALLVDISPREHPLAGRLAREMGARYLPLPYADPGILSERVKAAAR